MRPLSPPVAAARRALPPARPAPFPWASLLVAGFFLGAIALYWKKGQDVYMAAAISGAVASEPSTWYRLIAGLFVHGAHHELQALMVIGVAVFGCFRVERALGAGGMLLCLLAGGVVGDALRTMLETSALLRDSAGTTAAAMAVIGAAASVQVRTREKNFASAIASAIGSALFTLVLSAAPQQAPAIMRVLPPMLPAAGAAFLVGGFLGAVFPLYDPQRRRALRGATLLVTLAVLGFGAYGYGNELWPLLRPNPHRRPAKVDEPELDPTWDKRLPDFEFGLPLSHRIDEAQSTKFKTLVITPNLSTTPVITIDEVPRGDPRFDAEGIAFESAQLMKKQFAEAKPVDEGEIRDIALDRAYRQIVRIVTEDQRTQDRHICIAQTPDHFVRIVIFADPDELEETKALGDAIVRSLKVRSPPSDKKDGGPR